MKHWFIGSTNTTAIQFFRYFWLGCSSALVDLVVFTFCLKVLGFNWYISAPIAYAVGTIWNYIISIFWVFESKNIYKEFVAVCLISAGGLLWTYALLYLFIDIWSLNEVFAKMVSQVLILGWNFSLRKWVVF